MTPISIEDLLKAKEALQKAEVKPPFYILVHPDSVELISLLEKKSYIKKVGEGEYKILAH